MDRSQMHPDGEVWVVTYELSDGSENIREVELLPSQMTTDGPRLNGRGGLRRMLAAAHSVTVADVHITAVTR